MGGFPNAAQIVYANLFDRFGHGDDADPRHLAEDLADMLSGRQTVAGRGLGVLSWGLPSMMNMTATSPGDRQYVAECIAGTIRQFEPKLEQVKVTPVDGAKEFAFTIEATIVEEASSIQLRILSPYVGGSLGAKVEVVSIREEL